MHIDLKNALWSFRLPPRARRIFCFRPGLGLLAVELERLPFGWKNSRYFYQTALARVLQGVLSPGFLLVHCLDDFLLVYTEEGVLREAGRAAVHALVEAGFLISPKSVLDPVQLVSQEGPEPNNADGGLRYPSTASAVGGMDEAGPWRRGWAAPPPLPWLAKLARASAWARMPFWGRGVVLAPVGADGGRGAATEPGPAY